MAKELILYSSIKAFEELEVKSTLPAATWWQDHIFNQDRQRLKTGPWRDSH